MENLRVIIFSVSMIMMVIIILILWKMNDVLESPGTYEGALAYGFEGRVFVPCKYPEEVWWVTEVDNDTAMNIHYSTTGDHYMTAYAVVEVEVSARGSHGHMGMYDRKAKIIKVQSISTTFPEGCSKT